MRKVSLIIVAIALFWQVSSAQTTDFTYQGSLKVSGAPANGNHDFEFRLWTEAAGGSQVGSTITLNNVVVTNGIFSVTLNFGNNFPEFSQLNRFLEVRVRPTGGGAFTTLAPRERIKTVPYAVTSLNAHQSLNADQLGGVAANQYVTTTTGGANFIQNTTTQQASSNFNISGTGTANVFAAATQYNIGGLRMLAANGAYSSPLFPPSLAASNTFVGEAAGVNTTPNPTLDLVQGKTNSFFGAGAGRSNTIGSGNTFVGVQAGSSNADGLGNTIIGAYANVGAGGLSNATAIGSGAVVSQSNTLVLGSGVKVGIGLSSPSFKLHVVDLMNTGIRVQNSQAGGTVASFGEIGAFQVDASGTPGGRFTIQENGNVGIGTNAPQQTLHVNGLEVLSTGSQAGFKFRSRGSTSSNDDWVWYSNLNIARLFKAGVGDLLTIQPTGEFAVNVLGSAGATALCRNASNQISTCSSSARYKKDIASYKSGLSLIKQLRPVSFNWKAGGMADLGLVAEEVADVEPLLTTLNDKGEVEGVKYDRIGVIAVNAIKEQQAEISALRAMSSEQAKKISDQNSKIADQQKQIDELKRIVCSLTPDAEVCKEE